MDADSKQCPNSKRGGWCRQVEDDQTARIASYHFSAFHLSKNEVNLNKTQGANNASMAPAGECGRDMKCARGATGQRRPSWQKAVEKIKMFGASL